MGVDPELVPTHKTCKVCGELLPMEAFNRDRARSDGRKMVCRECQHAEDARKARENRAKEPPASKKCPSCNRTMPPSEFRKDAKRKDGFDTYCRKCRKAKENGMPVTWAVGEQPAASSDSGLLAKMRARRSDEMFGAGWEL